MNAAIRAVVRTCLNHQISISGVQRGYQGLIEGDIKPLNRSSVANIIQRGGTILKTSRSSEFHKSKGRNTAFEHLKHHAIDGVIVIGGDGSFRGAMALEKQTKIKTIGIPGTIDNDVPGTDDTIGYDSAVNTALSAIDRIRDTATSHERLFLVEVMGRRSGFIALSVGVAGGAERVFIPERKTSLKDLAKSLDRSLLRGKKSSIVVVAEGAFPHGASGLQKELKRQGYDPRICILGHTQRGGAPTAHDRFLASHLGAQAVLTLSQGRSNGMMGIHQGSIRFVSFASMVKKKKKVNPTQLELLEVLAT